MSSKISGSGSFPSVSYAHLAGHYRLEEVEAPEGYVKAEPVEFEIGSDVAQEVEPETGAIIIKLDYKNERQTGTLRIHKTGEKLQEDVYKRQE